MRAAVLQHLVQSKNKVPQPIPPDQLTKLTLSFRKNNPGDFVHAVTRVFYFVCVLSI
jgi:hypothetical protein